MRELQEETSLQADPDDLRFPTIVHVEFVHLTLYLVTYAVDRSKVSGDLRPEFEDFEAEFVPLADLRADPDQIRDNDLERIQMTFES